MYIFCCVDLGCNRCFTPCLFKFLVWKWSYGYVLVGKENDAQLGLKEVDVYLLIKYKNGSHA